MIGTVRATPAPVGGWNARDSLADMREDQAVLLDNWFPQQGKVTLRKGNSSYATTLGGDVETLAEYHDGATQKFLAAANGNIWDISSSGAGSSLASGYANNRWSWVNFNGSMSLVNGADSPQQFDGSTISALTISGSGLTTSTLIGNYVYKSRVYYWADNSQDFWYTAVNAIGGSLTKFPLSRVSKFGGKLMAMGSWSRDSGAGADDVAVFLMSSGEAIVYSGSDPSTDYSLIGIYQTGAPIGRRCLVRVGGDLVIITKDGFISAKELASVGRTQKGAVSSQINPAVVDAAKTYSGNFGWQAILYPRGNMLLFNIPITTNTTYHQYVFNTITGAPCRFKGWDARCFGIYNDKLYFGGNGTVYLADDGVSDNGANIDGDAITAPNYLGSRSRQKLVTALQPVMSSDGTLPIAVSVATDFATPAIPYNASSFSTTGADWYSAVWYSADWAGGDNVVKQWLSAGDLGFSVSSRVKVSVNAQKVNWFATNYMYKLGGLV